MFSQTYYLVRSRADGRYLAAYPTRGREPEAHDPDKGPEKGYLLLFKEHFEALSYLNAHAQELADRFGVESIPGTQLESLIKRWSFSGVGVVQDPLLPKVEFLSR